MIKNRGDLTLGGGGVAASLANPGAPSPGYVSAFEFLSLFSPCASQGTLLRGE